MSVLPKTTEIDPRHLVPLHDDGDATPKVPDAFHPTEASIIRGVPDYDSCGSLGLAKILSLASLLVLGGSLLDQPCSAILAHAEPQQ